MRKYFSINGYWKDDGSEFENYIVTNYHDWNPMDLYSEEDIFLYGYEKEDLKEINAENDFEDFVVTSIKEVEDY